MLCPCLSSAVVSFGCWLYVYIVKKKKEVSLYFCTNCPLILLILYSAMSSFLGTALYWFISARVEGLLTKTPSSGLQEIAKRAVDSSKEYQSPLEGFFLAGVKVEDQVTGSRSRPATPAGQAEKLRVSNKRKRKFIVLLVNWRLVQLICVSYVRT